MSRDGQSFTQAVVADNAGNNSAEIWYLDNPNTGTNDIAITLGGTNGFMGAGAIVLEGTDTGGPEDTDTLTSTGSNPSLTLTSTVDAFVVGAICFDNQDGSFAAADTVIYNIQATRRRVASYELASGTSTTISYTNTSTARAFAAASFPPAPAGTTGSAVVDFGGLTVAAAGAVTKVGAIAVALGALAMSVTGAVAHTGTVDVAFGGMATTATGTVARTGSADAAFGGLTIASTGHGPGAVDATGSADVAFGGLSVAASGTVGHTGVVVAGFGTLGVTSTGDVSRTGAALVSFGGLTITATGSTPTATTGSASAQFGTLTITGTVPVVSAGGYACLFAKAPTVTLTASAAQVTLEPRIATVSLVASRESCERAEPTVVDVVNNALVRFGTLTITSSGLAPPEEGTATATFGTFAATATGTVEHTGSASVALGTLTVTAVSVNYLSTLSGDTITTLAGDPIEVQ